MDPVWLKKNGVIQDLFGSVFWPGAAGSILWSVGSIIHGVVEKPKETAYFTLGGALLLLLALSVYSVIVWIQTRIRDFVLDARFVVFETLHLILVALCAMSVATTLRAPLEDPGIVNPTSVFFMVYFGVNVTGHLLGAWEPPEKRSAKLTLAAANFLGIVLLVFLSWYGFPTVWATFFAYIVVILIWWIFARGAKILDAVTAHYG